MPFTTRTVTRRAFLSGPAAFAITGGVLRRPANALTSPELPAKPSESLAEATVLSVRSVGQHGLFGSAWLPRLFEADLLFNDAAVRRDVALHAATVLAGGAFNARNFSKLQLVRLPKNKHGELRIFAILEPTDLVAYSVLAVLAAPAIEVHKIPAPAGIVHSYRFRPEGAQLFDRQFTFNSFLAAASRRAEQEGYIVHCDFANCYGTLHHARVAVALERSGVASWQMNYISELLAFWQTEESPGLPVGTKASNIFAEAVLLQVDKTLRGSGVDFVRYVDDFRIFAPDEAGARRGIAALADAAGIWGLSLNRDKTKIVHFVNAGTREDGLLARKALSTGIREYPVREAQAVTPKKVYGQILPLKFRRASVGEIRYLRRAAWRLDAAPFVDGEPASPTRLRRAIRRAIYTGDWEFVGALPALLRRYPEFASYVASALRQTSTFVPADIRRGLRIGLEAMLLSPETPDFVAMKLINILSHPDYRARRALEQFTEARMANPRGLCFRLALDALRNTGGLTPELSKYFERMDNWSQRAVFADPRMRASINLVPRVNDPFIARLMARRKLGSSIAES